MLLKIISLSLISCLSLQNFVTPLNKFIYKNSNKNSVDDVHPIIEGGKAIEHINIYSKHLKFRVHYVLGLRDIKAINEVIRNSNVLNYIYRE